MASHLTGDVSSALGVNSRVELMDAERLASAASSSGMRARG